MPGGRYARQTVRLVVLRGMYFMVTEDLVRSICYISNKTFHCSVLYRSCDGLSFALALGTYTLNSNYPKSTDQSLANDGHNTDQTLCEGFDEDGNTRGISTAFQNNLDYHNNFVGHYVAGDIQYNGHQSYDNLQLIYWKETKNFENGCSAHITGGSFASGNMA